MRFSKCIPIKTSPKGFSASKCDVGNWIFSKSWVFFEKVFGILGGFFWNLFVGFFVGFFGEEFFKRIFF